MKKLPWKKEKDKSLDDKVYEQMDRCLEIMETETDIDSERYKSAFRMYINLRKSLEEDNKIKANKRGRVMEIAATLGLGVVTLTAEQWTPLTSKWWGTIVKQIRGRDI